MNDINENRLDKVNREESTAATNSICNPENPENQEKNLQKYLQKAIGIIDYGAGNLGSVKKALDYLDIKNTVISDSSQLWDYAGIILPGVGAFGSAAAKLESAGFYPALRQYVKQDRNLLGICLGMQLFMESSQESPGVEGLGLIKGTNLRFVEGKVPQMGWNGIRFQKGSPLFKDISPDDFFYFVHSYYIQPQDSDPSNVVAASTRYYTSFPSIVERSNLRGFQFHPEKSGKPGLQLLRNWVQICGLEVTK